MKLRFTTPALKQFATKSLLVVAAVVIVSAVPFSAVPKVHADQYDDKINALQAQVNQYKAQAAGLQQKIGSLQDAIAGLQAQQSAIQAQITLNEAKAAQLNQQIADTTQKIADNKDALGKTLADMYVDNSISPIEMLASAKNIGDYVDKQSYRASVGDQLQSTITKINTLKASLTKDKAAVDAVLADQQVQKNSLVASQQQQQSLLDQTKGEQASYQQLMSAAQAQLDAASAAQRAYYQSLISSGAGVDSGVSGSFQWANWSGSMGCGNGYPYCGPQDSTIDPWQLYNRECVSYVAWSIAVRFHRSVNGFHGQGNAYQWPSSAPAYSGAYRVSDPQPGDAVILPPGPFAPTYGHAMVVESVGGGWVHVSQFNMYGDAQYSTMDIKPTGVIFLRFPS